MTLTRAVAEVITQGDASEYRYFRDICDAKGNFLRREFSNDPTFADGPESTLSFQDLQRRYPLLPLPSTERCQSPLTYRGVDVGLPVTAEDVIRARDHYAEIEQRWRKQR